MITRSVEQISEMLGSLCISSSKTPVVITGVSTDSRTTVAGNAFIPLVGEHFDGHAHIAQAIDRGASAVLWQADHGQPPEAVPVIVVQDTLLALQQLARAYRQQLPVTIIAITGSNGKTTTKDILASLFSTTFRVHKTKGNLNNHIGVPLTLLSMPEDTQMAVIEMGMSAAGEIKTLSEITQPDAAVITMIGEAHMLQLGSREAIASAKLEILSGLNIQGVFVYDGDDPWIDQCLTQPGSPYSIEKCEKRTFGRTTKQDYYPLEINLKDQGTQFQINHSQFPTLYMPLLGEHNVMNALAAIATATYYGVQPVMIKQGLQSIQLTSMRIEQLQAPSGFTILHDAYNASPSSVIAAIRLMEQLHGYQRKIMVLGDMLELGQDEEQYHREIGMQLSPEVLAYVFTYGALASYIAIEASKKSFLPHQVAAYDHKPTLIHDLQAILQPGDVVLVKASRGMRLEEIVQALLAHS
jgi:UDP-N-acetylmuramoyl-tripeptide--D-alanyl-D-alanine ligase